MDIPYYYDYRNRSTFYSVPSTVHLKENATCRFFANYLLQKAISVYEWELPEQWAENYFLYCLYGIGYIAVINTDKFGVIPQHCTLSGYNVFYQPTRAVVANPLIKIRENPEIGINCELIKLQPNYGSIMDIVYHFASRMALIVETGDVNIMNSKLSYLFFAENKAQAETFKKVYDEISSGNPVAFVGKELKHNPKEEPNWMPFLQNVGGNYIYTDLLSDLRKVEAMFDTYIGIPNANTDKRERLITDEVNANNAETDSLCGLWLHNLQESTKKVNKMFGLSISVKMKEIEREVEDNESKRVNVNSDDSGAS